MDLVVCVDETTPSDYSCKCECMRTMDENAFERVGRDVREEIGWASDRKISETKAAKAHLGSMKTMGKSRKIIHASNRQVYENHHIYQDSHNLVAYWKNSFLHNWKS